MAYLVIENFKFGLDARRSELTSKPGTLVNLENAHITDGGEVEKRKAFVRTPLNVTHSGGTPVPTYGMTALKDTIEIYGATAEGAIDGASVPTGFTYRLIRRQVVATSHNITAFIDSTVFGGKSVVIAQLSDGSTSLFYDGVYLQDITTGYVFSWGTSHDMIMIQLVLSIVATGLYTGDYVLGSSVAQIYGPPGASYTMTLVVSSASGTLTERKIADTIPGTTAQIASGAFKVLAGSVAAGTNKVTQIAVGATNLLTAAVDFVTDTIQTALALVTAINANTGTSGYRASAESSLVRIYSSTTGTTPNNKVVTVTAAGDVCVGNCIFSFAGTGFNLNYINANGVNILSAIMLYPTFGGQTLSAYVETVAANIRAGVGTHGYVAKALGTGLYVSKAVTASSDVPIVVDVEVVPTAGNSGVVFEGSDIPALVSLSRAFTVFQRLNADGSYWISDSVTVTIIGGVPPYSYRWLSIGEVSELSTQSRLVRITALQPTERTCQFQLFAATIGPRPVPFVPSGSVTVYCDIEDALGAITRSPNLTLVLPGSGGF